MYKSKLLQYYHLNISTRKYIRAVSSSSQGVRMAPLISQTEPYNITTIHRFTTEGFYANIVRNVKIFRLIQDITRLRLYRRIYELLINPISFIFITPKFNVVI